MRLLDTDYLAFSVLMAVFGIVGITATAHVTPNIIAQPTCGCVPSVAARLQELSVILLVGGVIIAPLGMMRPSKPSPMLQQAASMGGEEPYPGIAVRSGGMIAIGVALVVFGIALVAVPSFIVLGNDLLIGEGAGMVVLGVFFAYYGSRSG